MCEEWAVVAPENRDRLTGVEYLNCEAIEVRRRQGLLQTASNKELFFL